MPNSTKAGLRASERPASKILRGLEEAAAWANGKGQVLVHIPGQPPRMMTRPEFDAVASNAPATQRLSLPWLCEVTGRAEAVGSVACLCRGCRGAALEAENANLRAEIDGVDLAFEGLEETERGRRIGRWIGEAADAMTRASQAEEEAARLREVLAWYGEQARLCRLIHSEGDVGRQALDADGGKRAEAALSRVRASGIPVEVGGER